MSGSKRSKNKSSLQHHATSIVLSGIAIATTTMPAALAANKPLPMQRIGLDNSRQLVFQFADQPGGFPSVPRVLDMPGPNHRLVVDFDDVTIDRAAVPTPDEMVSAMNKVCSAVKAIRYSLLPNSTKSTTRIVVDLPEDLKVSPRVVKMEENSVTINLGEGVRDMPSPEPTNARRGTRAVAAPAENAATSIEGAESYNAAPVAVAQSRIESSPPQFSNPVAQLRTEPLQIRSTPAAVPTQAVNQTTVSADGETVALKPEQTIDDAKVRDGSVKSYTNASGWDWNSTKENELATKIAETKAAPDLADAPVEAVAPVKRDADEDALIRKVARAEGAKVAEPATSVTESASSVPEPATPPVVSTVPAATVPFAMAEPETTTVAPVADTTPLASAPVAETTSVATAPVADTTPIASVPVADTTPTASAPVAVAESAPAPQSSALEDTAPVPQASAQGSEAMVTAVAGDSTRKIADASNGLPELRTQPIETVPVEIPSTAVPATKRAEPAAVVQDSEIPPSASASAAPTGGAEVSKDDTAQGLKLYNSAVKNHLSGKLMEAISDYKAALVANPQMAEAHSNLGLIFNQQHNYAGALNEFHKALAINPRDAITYNGIGAALRAEKDLLGAIKNWQTAVDIDPKLATAHYNLGTAYEIQKDYDKALSAYGDAVKNDYRLGEAYYRMGLILQQKHQLEDAEAQFKQALKINGAAEYSADAKQRIASLSAQKK